MTARTHATRNGGAATRGRFYAVRVTVTHADGCVHERDYVRGLMRVAQSAFDAYALGDMILLTNDAPIVDWTVDPITKDEVR